MIFGHINGHKIPLGALGTGAQDLTVNYANPLTDEPKVLDGTCTSDGRLIWKANAWRVLSDDSTNSCVAKLPDWTAQQIINKGYQIFVGPFPWTPNPNANASVNFSGVSTLGGGQLTGELQNLTNVSVGSEETKIYDYTKPGQINALWRGWLGSTIAKTASQFQPPSGNPSNPATLPGWTTRYVPGPCDQSYAFANPTFMHCANPSLGCNTNNDVFKKTWLCPDQSWVCNPVVSSTGLTNCQCSSDPGGCMGEMSQNSQTVTKIWSGADSDGTPAQFVKYQAPNDINTYLWYSPADWLDSFQKNLSFTPNVEYFFTDLSKNGFGTGGAGTTLDSIASKWFQYHTIDWTNPSTADNAPPVAKFRHPVNGEIWGLYLGYLRTGGTDLAPGAWNSATDEPDTAQLIVGIGPLPQTPWWAGIEDALEWIPDLLGDIASSIVGAALSALELLVCTNPTAALQQASKDPVALAAVLAAKALCPSTTNTIDCTNPANAAICTPQTASWWSNPVIIVGAIVAFFAIIAFTSKDHPKE